MAEVLGTFEQAVLLEVLRLRDEAYGRAILKAVQERLDAITRLESVLDAHNPQNAALVECLHRFVEGTRGGTGW